MSNIWVFYWTQNYPFVIISSIKKKISRAISIMQQNEKFCLSKCFNVFTLWPSLSISHSYAFPILGVACENIINLLYVLQKRAVGPPFLTVLLYFMIWTT